MIINVKNTQKKVVVTKFVDVDVMAFLNGEKFLVSPKKKRKKTLANNIRKPPFLLGIAFNILYWHKKYHSGTICKGVKKAQASKALSGWERVDRPK
jgi:hypothetical protein